MAPAHLEVAGIVERRDLHQAGAELAVHRGVGHERQPAADQRQHRRLAVEMGVALVVRMQGHGRVAEHRLRAGRRHHDALVAPLHRIGDVVELARHRLHLHFEVGDGGAEGGRPVDHVLAAGDEPLAMEADEGLAHRPGEAGVEGEALARPVAGSPHQVELLADVAVIQVLPLPHPLQEALAPELAAAGALGRELALHHQLSGNAGVIGARQPEGVCSPACAASA